MNYFISIDTQLKRRKILWIFPIGKKVETPVVYSIFGEDGISTGHEWDWDSETIIDAFIRDKEGHEGAIYPDEYTGRKLVYEELEYIPGSYELLVDAICQNIPDNYFSINQQDFNEVYPESRRPYSQDQKVHMFTAHKLYKKIKKEDKCGLRAKKMYENYQLLKSISSGV